MFTQREQLIVDRIEPYNCYKSTSVSKEFGIYTPVVAQTNTILFYKKPCYKKPCYKKVSLIFTEKTKGRRHKKNGISLDTSKIPKTEEDHYPASWV